MPNLKAIRKARSEAPLDEVLRVYTRGEKRDAFGGVTSTFVDVGNFWARRDEQLSDIVTESGAGRTTVAFVVNWNPIFVEGVKAVDRDGGDWRVDNIELVGRRRYMLLRMRRDG